MNALMELNRIKSSVAIVFVMLFVSRYFRDVNDLALLGYKLSVVCLAWIVWHLLRSETFPYLDFRTVLEGRDMGTKIAAGIVLGLSCVAVVLGVTLGL